MLFSSPLMYVDPYGLAAHNPNSQYCRSIRRRLRTNRQRLEERWEEYRDDFQNLPERVGPHESLRESRRGHRTLINRADQYVRRLENQLRNECGDDDNDNSSGGSGMAVSCPAGENCSSAVTTVAVIGGVCLTIACASNPLCLATLTLGAATTAALQ